MKKTKLKNRNLLLNKDTLRRTAGAWYQSSNVATYGACCGPQETQGGQCDSNNTCPPGTCGCGMNTSACSNPCTGHGCI
jgi:hypothetical protein